jgi:hypothetical protein
MNLTDMMAAVYVETARPDLIDETKNALVAAITQYHSFDYFWKDIATAQVVFDTSTYIQVLDLQNLPRFRATSFLRKYDPTIAAQENNPSILPPLSNPYWNQQQVTGFIDLITPDDIFDEFGSERVDVGYGVGGAIMIKSSTSLKYLQVGWYQYPIVDTVTNGGNLFGEGSFIAADYPYLLIYAAASSVMQKIGQNDASRKYDNPNNGLIQQQLEAMLRSNILVKGY